MKDIKYTLKNSEKERKKERERETHMKIFLYKYCLITNKLTWSIQFR